MSKKIIFPRDEKAHDFIVEWWYLNGILKDLSGNKYAFMDCLFKVDPKIITNIPRLPRRYIYFSHAVFSDIKNRKFYYQITPVSVSRDSFKKKLLYIKYKKFALTKITDSKLEETKPFIYKINSDFLDLNLISTKKALLEQKNGYVHLNTKSTYYYSLTNLKADGYIKLNNKIIPVQGKSWLDHQWANSDASLDKWIWFCIQLEDNREFVCFEFDDKHKKTALVGYIDGKSKTFHTNKVKFIPFKKSWRSKKTGTLYPLEYKIEIPSLKASLKTTPLMQNQEVLFGNINYWEGPTKISGTINSKKVKGFGFMELVGFPKNKSLIKIYNQIIKQELKKRAKETREQTYKISKKFLDVFFSRFKL